MFNSEKVTIITEGYVRGEGPWEVSSTCCLIKDSGKAVLVDPGSAPKEVFLASLEKAGHPKGQGVDMVYLTHYHPDHVLNIRFLDDSIPVYEEDLVHSTGTITYFESPTIPGTDIKIVKTPGHAHEHSSLLVQDSDQTICIAADVFWWEEGQEPEITKEGLMSITDPYVKNEEALQNSRRIVLESGADWIIPGHGKVFMNPLLG